jgi:hypothetical protein
LGTYYSDLASYGGYKGSKKKDLDSPLEFISKEQNMGDLPNVYLGQWDAIKEKMVLGVMEKEKVVTTGIFEIGKV